MTATRESRPPDDAGDAPALSVVVVSLGSAASFRDVLHALADQRGAPPLEVIVPVDERVRATLDAGNVSLRGARIVAVPGRVSSWVLRAEGVRAARAPLVATLEDCALPGAGWAARIVAAHAGSDAAVGGPVEKRLPDGAVGWAMYFFDYGRYVPPLGSARVSYLSACNVSYKRAALERVRETWRDAMHETDVHWALLGKGETMLLDEQVVVQLRREVTLRAARDEVRAHGELFGRGRRMSAPARVLRVLTAPILPFVLLARSATPLLRAPGLIGPWFRALPAAAVLAAAWAVGEVRGYLTRSQRP